MVFAAPTKIEGISENIPRMIGWPEASRYNNPLGAVNSTLGGRQYDVNDLLRLLGEGGDVKEVLTSFFQGGSRPADVTEEESDLPQTPPQSPKRDNPGHPRHPEDGPSLARRNTDSGSTQPLLGGDISDQPTSIKKKRSSTFPNTNPAIFFDAIKAGDIAAIQRELKNGTDLEITDEFGFTPLWRAVDIGERNVIQLLLDNGANYEAKFLGQTSVLEWALDKGKGDIVNMVLAKMDAKSKPW